MNSDKVKGRKKSKKIGAGGDIGEMAGSVIHAEVEWEKEAQKLEWWRLLPAAQIYPWVLGFGF